MEYEKSYFSYGINRGGVQSLFAQSIESNQQDISQNNILNKQNTQEKNGAFIGIGMGFGSGYMRMNVKNVRIGNIAFSGQAFDDNENFLNLNIKAGYQHFFNRWVGLRAYGLVGYSEIRKVANSVYSNLLVAQDYSMIFINYNANLDVLLNAYNSQDLNFGFFVGLGIGGSFNNYTDAKLTNTATGAIWSRDMHAFYMDFKLGARINAAKHHGMELGITIPFIEVKDKWSTNIQQARIPLDVRIKQNYSVGLSYNYIF